MARRKSEPQSVHRKKICEVAERLFMEKGIEKTTMSDIANESGYSKATLYVYFKDKDELVGVLVLASMQKLYDYIRRAVNKEKSTREQFFDIFRSLMKYQKKYPLYFHMVLENINIDFESTGYLPEEKETFMIGEKINALIGEYIKEGMEKGDIRNDLDIVPTIFSIWGMASGTILLATNKEDYIRERMKKSKEEYVMYGAEMLFRSISA